MATTPPINLASVPQLQNDEIQADLTRVLAQATSDAKGLGYLTLNQLKNSVIAHNLVFSAKGILAAPVVGGNLAANTPLTFNIKEEDRLGYAAGSQIVASINFENRINARVVNYDSVTGDLQVLVIEGQGTTSAQTWDVTFAVPVTTAATVNYLPPEGFPTNIKDVQAVLDWVTTRMRTSKSRYDVTTTANQTLFKPTNGYNPFGLDVFIDGRLIRPAQYQATDGVNIIMNVPQQAGLAFTSISLQLNVSDADLDTLANVAFSGNAQDLTEGSTKKLLTDGERTKLAGIAIGATANATNEQLRDRSTHTGDQPMSTVSGLLEALGQYLPSSEKGVTVATLDDSGKVPSVQLPSYVDDVLDYPSRQSLPATGESGKIYVATDVNKQYRWTGSTYAEIISSPGTSDEVTEGTLNKYFTDSRATAAVIGSGYSEASTADITTTDSILQALGKLGARVKGLLSSVALKLDRAGDVMSGSLGIKDNIKLIPVSEDMKTFRFSHSAGGNMIVQASTDGFVTDITDVAVFDATGQFRALNGFKSVKSILVPTATDANTLMDAAIYDGNELVNMPFVSTDWWYIETIRHSLANTYIVQRAIILNNGNTEGWWTRKRVAGVWERWTPEGGWVRPSHYGASGYANVSTAIDQTAKLQLWFASPFPKTLDAWYATSQPLSCDLSDKYGFILQGTGMGRCGIRLDQSAYIQVSGADVGSPSDAQSDAVTMKDFNIGVNSDTVLNALAILYAAGRMGSANPTLTLENIEIKGSEVGSQGFTGAGIYLRNCRNRILKNLHIQGRYNLYRGNGIEDNIEAGSAPVHCQHIGVNVYHVNNAHLINAAAGSVQYDDAQGYNWIGCNMLAANKGVWLSGNSDLFMDAFTFMSNHFNCREAGIYGTDVRRVVAIGNNFLGMSGGSGAVQGIVLTTANASISMRHKIIGNDFQFEGLTNSVRIGVQITGGNARGIVVNNECSGATTAYQVPASTISTPNVSY